MKGRYEVGEGMVTYVLRVGGLVSAGVVVGGRRSGGGVRERRQGRRLRGRLGGGASRGASGDASGCGGVGHGGSGGGEVAGSADADAPAARGDGPVRPAGRDEATARELCGDLVVRPVLGLGAHVGDGDVDRRGVLRPVLGGPAPLGGPAGRGLERVSSV